MITTHGGCCIRGIGNPNVGNLKLRSRLAIVPYKTIETIFKGFGIDDQKKQNLKSFWLEEKE